MHLLEPSPFSINSLFILSFLSSLYLSLLFFYFYYIFPPFYYPPYYLFLPKVRYPFFFLFSFFSNKRLISYSLSTGWTPRNIWRLDQSPTYSFLLFFFFLRTCFPPPPFFFLRGEWAHKPFLPDHFFGGLFHSPGQICPRSP